MKHTAMLAAIIASLCLSACSPPDSASDGLKFFEASEGLPVAPTLDYDTRDEPICAEDLRKAENDTERSVVNRGWILPSAALSLGDTRAIFASAGLGGQCRPIKNGVFFFHGNRYLGYVQSIDETAFPRVHLTSESEAKIEVSFRKNGDPSCCPSGRGLLDLELQRFPEETPNAVARNDDNTAQQPEPDLSIPSNDATSQIPLTQAESEKCIAVLSVTFRIIETTKRFYGEKGAILAQADSFASVDSRCTDALFEDGVLPQELKPKLEEIRRTK